MAVRFVSRRKTMQTSSVIVELGLGRTEGFLLQEVRETSPVSFICLPVLYRARK